MPIFIDRGAPLRNTLLTPNAAVFALDRTPMALDGQRQCQLAAIGPTAARSGKRVSQVDRLEFPEITVIGVQRADAVLEQDGCDVGVRD